MKISGIFTLVQGVVYALEYDNEGVDAYHKWIKNWQDSSFLEDYFAKPVNLENLQMQTDYRYSTPSNNEIIAQAMVQINAEASKLSDVLEDARSAVSAGDRDAILEKFHFLHKLDPSRTYPYIQLKLYGPSRKSLIRLYGVFVDLGEHGFTVITGGGIKLTTAMQDDKLLELERRRLNNAVTYLRSFFS